MVEYFVRFVASEEQAKFDLERGHSFHGYNLMPKVEDLLENDGYEITEDGEVLDYDGNVKFASVEDAAYELDIRQDNATGMWGYAADGLAGFGPFESLEEALEEEPYCKYYGGEFVSIWIGDNRQDLGIFEGTSFRPFELVLVRPRAN